MSTIASPTLPIEVENIAITPKKQTLPKKRKTQRKKKLTLKRRKVR